MWYIVEKIEDAVLVDHLKSLDWATCKASFHSKADAVLLAKVRLPRRPVGDSLSILEQAAPAAQQQPFPLLSVVSYK
jgi:hypothetical protein